MKTTLAFFRLIRWQNLIILAFTLFLVRYWLVYPLIRHFTINHFSHAAQKWEILSFDFELQMPFTWFLLLITAILSIAAAGYVVNDYFDKDNDHINRPDEVIVDRLISANATMNIYYFLNFTGLLAGTILSVWIGKWNFMLIFLLTAGLLWYYSTIYKKMLLIGNVIVALLVAIVPLLVPLFDVLALNAVYKPTLLNYGINFNRVFVWVGVYSLFAFLLNFVREIIKDLEDFEGDSMHGRQTLPINAGSLVSKVVVSAVLAAVVLLIVYLQFYYFPNHLMYKFILDGTEVWYAQFRPDFISMIFTLVFLILPLLVLAALVWRAHTVQQYKVATIITKGVMIAGLLYTFFIRHLFLNFPVLIE